MPRSCKRVFSQRGYFLFDKKHTYINNQIIFKDHVLSPKHQIDEKNHNGRDNGCMNKQCSNPYNTKKFYDQVISHQK